MRACTGICVRVGVQFGFYFLRRIIGPVRPAGILETLIAYSCVSVYKSMEFSLVFGETSFLLCCIDYLLLSGPLVGCVIQSACPLNHILRHNRTSAVPPCGNYCRLTSPTQKPKCREWWNEPKRDYSGWTH
jgi:hypothetical protein